MKRIIKQDNRFIPEYKSMFMRHNYYYDDTIYWWVVSFDTMQEAHDFLYPKKLEKEIVFDEQEIYNVDIATPLIWLWIIACLIYLITTSIKC